MPPLGYQQSDSAQSHPDTTIAIASLPPYPPPDTHFLDATAPPPSEANFDLQEQHSDQNNRHTLSLTDHHHHAIDIIRITQDAIAQIDHTQTSHNTSNQLVHSSQYCNRFGRPVANRLQSVISRLESDDLHVTIVISRDDSLKSIKSQIANHKSIFELLGYPHWSKDIIPSAQHFKNHSWCHLVFRGALESDEQSVRSEFINLMMACQKAHRALDIGAIQHLPDYIEVLKSLDRIHERVQKYGMCSTEYQITVKSGLYKSERHAFIAGPAGCRMSEPSSDGFKSKSGRTPIELVVWPPPASGRLLLRRPPQIVELQVAKEIVASKFQDLELRDVEDLGLEKLRGDDLKLLLNTPRFANGAAMLAHKFNLGNHITEGFMTNLARHWLLCTTERNESTFRNLLLLPDISSLDLIRVMIAAVDLGTSDQIRTLCLELTAKKHALECCEAIATAAVPYGITARARLCLECLDPAVLNAVWKARRDPQNLGHDSGILKFMLGFAERDMWRLRINAFLHLLEIDATDYSAALHADQVDNDEAAKQLERLARYLKHSNMRRTIINASRRLHDLELYVRMLNGEQLPELTQYTTLLMRLINAAGYNRVAELNVPIESGMDRQILSSWLLSGQSDGLCISGEIYLQSSLAYRNPAPSRDEALLGRLTGQGRLDKRGRWEFFSHQEEKISKNDFWLWSTWGRITTPVWKPLLENGSSAQSHAHLSEQLYFHTNGNELPNAQGLSLVKLERNGVGDLVGRGLTISPRIAKDIWHLGGCVYYSMTRGRLWKMEMEGTSCHAGQVEKLSGNFLVMSRGGMQNLTIS